MNVSITKFSSWYLHDLGETPQLPSFFCHGDKSTLFPFKVSWQYHLSVGVTTVLGLGDYRVTWAFSESSVSTWSKSIQYISWRWHIWLMETERSRLDSRDRFVSCLYHPDNHLWAFEKYLPLIVLLHLSSSVVTFIFWVPRTQWNRYRFKSALLFLLATWPWASNFISLRLHFLIYKRKKMTLQGCYKD